MTHPHVAVLDLEERFEALTTGDYNEAVGLIEDALSEIDRLRTRLSDERAAHEDAVMVTVSKWRGEVAEIDAYAMELHDLLGKARSGLALVMSETGLGELFFRQVDAALAKNPEAVSKRLKEAEIASERPAEPMPTAGSNPASLDSPLTSARRYETLCPWCGHGECTGGCGRDFSRTMGEPK